MELEVNTEPSRTVLKAKGYIIHTKDLHISLDLNAERHQFLFSKRCRLVHTPGIVEWK